jgi:hypothetical protein
MRHYEIPVVDHRDRTMRVLDEANVAAGRFEKFLSMAGSSAWS